jgi:hypothetical protein
MGFGDKLKGLKDQAQQAVAENKDKIQGAVQAVGETANTKTNGKYATKIMKAGEKFESSVDKFAEGAPAADAQAAADVPGPEAAAGTAGPEATAGTAGPEAAAGTAGPEATAGTAGPEATADAPDSAYSIEGDAPQEDCEDAPSTKEPHNPVTSSSADTASAGFPDFE